MWSDTVPADRHCIREHYIPLIFDTVPLSCRVLAYLCRVVSCRVLADGFSLLCASFEFSLPCALLQCALTYSFSQLCASCRFSLALVHGGRLIDKH